MVSEHKEVVLRLIIQLKFGLFKLSNLEGKFESMLLNNRQVSVRTLGVMYNTTHI